MIVASALPRVRAGRWTRVSDWGDPDAKGPADEIVEQDGVTVLIDPKASMFIFGTEMDYVEEKMQTGFVFRNPNEKGRCGCGESFHV